MCRRQLLRGLVVAACLLLASLALPLLLRPLLPVWLQLLHTRDWDVCLVV
jgi:hypothetical protein